MFVESLGECLVESCSMPLAVGVALLLCCLLVMFVVCSDTVFLLFLY